MKVNIVKILCPVDFSEGSTNALRYAVALGENFGAEVQLMHVVEMPFMPSYTTAGIPELSVPVEQVQQESRRRLEELAEGYEDICPDLVTHVSMGAPFVEIVQEAKRGEFDLIVIGTHGHGGLKHMLIGSVAEKVVRKAPCPVLTVKHPEHEFVMP
jgi:nucleotide-binding universal stress UspA family protein